MTSSDTTMLQLIKYMQHGLQSPQLYCEISTEPYFNLCGKLSVYDGLVVKGPRIIISEELRPYILKCLHRAYQGSTKTLARTKISVIWLHITKDITDITDGCDICQENCASNTDFQSHQQMNGTKPI